MSIGNSAHELADRRAEQERAAGIARVQAAARGQLASDEVTGPLVCDCGEMISPARRAAVPRTRQCVDCAALDERLRRRRA